MGAQEFAPTTCTPTTKEIFGASVIKKEKQVDFLLNATVREELTTLASDAIEGARFGTEAAITYWVSEFLPEVFRLVERFDIEPYSDFSAKLSNFRGLVLACINADFCNQILIFQHF